MIVFFGGVWKGAFVALPVVVGWFVSVVGCGLGLVVGWGGPPSPILNVMEQSAALGSILRNPPCGRPAQFEGGNDEAVRSIGWRLARVRIDRSKIDTQAQARPAAPLGTNVSKALGGGVLKRGSGPRFGDRAYVHWV